MLDPTFDVTNLGLFFQTTYECFGETRTYNLIPDGDQKAVTNHNKERKSPILPSFPSLTPSSQTLVYVDLFIQYKLVHSIGRQFDGFAKGFYTAVGDVLLSPNVSLRPIPFPFLSSLLLQFSDM
jgi:hypothetical protein